MNTCTVRTRKSSIEPWSGVCGKPAVTTFVGNPYCAECYSLASGIVNAVIGATNNLTKDIQQTGDIKQC